MSLRRELLATRKNNFKTSILPDEEMNKSTSSFFNSPFISLKAAGKALY